MNSDSNAPAVMKAFDLMAHLEEGRPKTLAELAAVTGQAKSSALRILRTLASLGVVARYEDIGSPSYILLKRLVSISMPSQVSLRMLMEIMTELADECEVSAEWFVPTGEGMMLADKAEPPENAVRVMAREGSCFKWERELDAVTALGYAFFAPSQPGGDLMCYVADGVYERLSPAVLGDRIENARLNGVDEDPFWNDYGVKRVARLVKSAEAPIAVLSVARNQRPGDAARVERIRAGLERAVRDVELRCAGAFAGKYVRPETVNA